MNWLQALTKAGVRQATATYWAPAFAEHVTADKFSAGEVEIVPWLSQVLHESALLERVEEGLSYSAERLMAVWPKRFPTIQSTQPYARNPVALANYVYGGRLGNVMPGDGWRFRGRGLIQVTGRENYTRLGAAMKLPLAEKPDLLLQPAHALQSAIVWWERNVPDAFLGDPMRVRRAVNGGTVGLEDTERLAGRLDPDGDGRMA